jgi:hypothetical protein
VSGFLQYKGEKMLNQSTKEIKDTKTNDGFFKEAINTAEKIVHIGMNTEDLRENASQIIEDGMEDAKRLAKRGRYAAEDLIEETAHQIKKEPFRSVGVTFGLGFGLGAALASLIAYRINSTKEH